MLLGIGHKARQGKDTAAEAIVNYYNDRRDVAMKHLAVTKVRGFNPSMESQASFEKLYPQARIFKFADELYRICREEYGMTEKDPALLQQVGDGRRKAFGLDYWIRRLEPSLRAFKGVAVISDMRYENEAEFVKSLGGWTLQVQRLHENGLYFVSPDRDPNFISEVELDGYNYDLHILSKSPVVTAETAITYAEYIRSLEPK